jgi:hypothetical protein
MNVARVNHRRVLAAFPAAVVVAGILAGCMGGGPSPVDPSASPDVSEAAARPSPNFAEEITEFAYSGQEGKTAIDLLEANDPEAEVEGSGKDARVVAIRGRAADEGAGQSWTLFVDGEQKEPVVATEETVDGQAIAWRLVSD